jgi:hypothetical protein
VTEQELGFYDMLTSRQAYFENLQQIREVVREIVKELGYYTKVADWNRK